eukprot:4162789-Amphidinium_carterae.3
MKHLPERAIDYKPKFTIDVSCPRLDVKQKRSNKTKRHCIESAYALQTTHMDVYSLRPDIDESTEVTASCTKQNTESREDGEAQCRQHPSNTSSTEKQML